MSHYYAYSSLGNERAELSKYFRDYVSVTDGKVTYNKLSGEGPYYEVKLNDDTYHLLFTDSDDLGKIVGESVERQHDDLEIRDGLSLFDKEYTYYFDREIEGSKYILTKDNIEYYSEQENGVLLNYNYKDTILTEIKDSHIEMYLPIEKDCVVVRELVGDAVDVYHSLQSHNNMESLEHELNRRYGRNVDVEIHCNGQSKQDELYEKVIEFT